MFSVSSLCCWYWILPINFLLRDVGAEPSQRPVRNVKHPCDTSNGLVLELHFSSSLKHQIWWNFTSCSLPLVLTHCLKKKKKLRKHKGTWLG